MTYRTLLAAVVASMLLASFAARASAQPNVSGQRVASQGVLSTFRWETPCATSRLEVNMGRTSTWNLGQPIERSAVTFVRYFVEDRCALPAIKRYGSFIILPEATAIQPSLNEHTVDLDLTLADAQECTQLDGKFTCVSRPIPIVGSVHWTGQGPIERLRSHSVQAFEGYLSFSGQFGRERAATATFAGTIEGEIVDVETSEARFARGANFVFELSWPQP